MRIFLNKWLHIPALLGEIFKAYLVRWGGILMGFAVEVRDTESWELARRSVKLEQVIWGGGRRDKRGNLDCGWLGWLQCQIESGFRCESREKTVIITAHPIVRFWPFSHRVSLPRPQALTNRVCVCVCAVFMGSTFVDFNQLWVENVCIFAEHE